MANFAVGWFSLESGCGYTGPSPFWKGRANNAVLCGVVDRVTCCGEPIGTSGADDSRIELSTRIQIREAVVGLTI
jgi:hypothetical protein